MDSGSGSFQSSSGDEEYDSRANVISAFMSNNSSSATAPAHVGPISSNPQRPPPPQTTTSMFDHHRSNFFDRPILRPPPPSLPDQQPLLNLDMPPWSKTLRSSNELVNPFQSLLGGDSGVSSTTYTTATQIHHHQQSVVVSIPPVVVPENCTSATNTPRDTAAASSDHPPHAARNPKKRSRASRRPPTTVLTTDTTNFRAMVQEFTGIPAPPFTSSPLIPRTRLDLYTGGGRSNHLEQPPYLHRPFPQKVQLPPPFFGAAAASALIDNSTDNSNNICSTSGLNINISPNVTAYDHHLNFEIPQPATPQQSSTLLMNPTLSSLLQSKFSPPQLSNHSHFKTGLGEFGQVNTATTLSGLPGLISSDHRPGPGPQSRNDHNPVDWGNGVTSSNDNHDRTQAQVRSGNVGNLNFSKTNAGNGKPN